MIPKRITALLFCMCLALFSASSVMSIKPGIYFANITSSISNGTTAPFIIHASKGLGVNVTALGEIYPYSSIFVEWDPFSGHDSYDATLSLKSLANPDEIFPESQTKDTGNATIVLENYGSFKPGMYAILVSNALGQGVSNSFLVLAPNPLSVKTDTDKVPTGEFLGLSWTPFNISDTVNISIARVSSGSQRIIATNLADTGSTSVELSYPPGIYELKLVSSLGIGSSNRFAITTEFNTIAVTVNPDSISSINGFTIVEWKPFDKAEEFVNLTLTGKDGLAYKNVSNVPNIGYYFLSASEWEVPKSPATYSLTIDSMLGSDSIELTMFDSATLNVIIDPSVVMSDGGAIDVNWSPIDPSEPLVNLSVYSGNDSLLKTLEVPNTGSYSDDVTSFGLFPGRYKIQVDSNMGSGFDYLIVSSATPLNILVPNSESIIYNNSASLSVQWTPFDENTTPAVITIINQNTMKNDYFSVKNNGNASLNLSSIDVPAGTYSLTVDTSIGSSGSPSMFVLLYPETLLIASPNSTTNVSNVGLLDIEWDPKNPAGENITIYLHHAVNNSISYGPFKTLDDGNATLDLMTNAINKNMLLEDAIASEQKAHDADVRAVMRALEPKNAAKKSSFHTQKESIRMK
ncbi:hypothetical protein MDAP_000093 [Mitosporidium daphniae]|uniref:Fibronectin type-III domain-containing protein n=1 Tax=Mitosporidium daphniae TaxID=1485682 RepID=A0A098VV10_9MICR|nr:uncharacterized protein DI09_124p30 [Mitosporidium daphniae]KGG52918.1 hypothetical protein DI09_124p30 [Mitosporidium daphniae]|eukprot:XP_013239354.1 uncharacterized protein DI09_124p30 [Mitosporidium daphniae]